MPSAAGGLRQVTAGVIARNGTVLICQRPLGGHHPLKWEFPGGKVELGESLEAGLRRELHEELGIDAVVGPALWCTQHRYAGRTPIALTFFAIPEYAGSITNRCFAATRWAPIGALHCVDFLEGDLEFVAEIDAGRVRLV